MTSEGPIYRPVTPYSRSDLRFDRNLINRVGEKVDPAQEYGTSYGNAMVAMVTGVSKLVHSNPMRGLDSCLVPTLWL